MLTGDVKCQLQASGSLKDSPTLGLAAVYVGVTQYLTLDHVFLRALFSVGVFLRTQFQKDYPNSETWGSNFLNGGFRFSWLILGD